LRLSREAERPGRTPVSDDWITPAELYADLDKEFNFDDDPCPLGGITLQDGLSRPWGKAVFMNPPYSIVGPWCKKAYEESQRGNTVVGLLKGDTSTAWFHEYVLGKAEVRFIRGRVGFINPRSGRMGRPPFPSIIVIWRPPLGID
jgi:phage N-6-adenine-methyltransferase